MPLCCSDKSIFGPKYVALKCCRGKGSTLERIYEEIAAMKLCESIVTLKSVRRSSKISICPRLYDFGFSRSLNSFILIMEHCEGGNLKYWRNCFAKTAQIECKHGAKHAKKNTSEVINKNIYIDQCLLFLDLFLEIAQAVAHLAEHKIIHFDLKCDNVLLRKWLKPNEVRTHLSEGLVCIGDFGQASVCPHQKRSAGLRLRHARGTECVQSPELILMNYRSGFVFGSDAKCSNDTVSDIPGGTSQVFEGCVPKSQGGAIARENKEAEHCAPSKAYATQRYTHIKDTSDIWSLGCLLFELITGDFLFDISNQKGGWSRFFVILTSEKEKVICTEKLELLRSCLPKSNYIVEVVVSLIESLLVRNPSKRPSARDTCRMVRVAIDKIKEAGIKESYS